LTNFFPDRSHRLVREVQTLLSAGHQVLVLSQKKAYPPEEEQYPAKKISGEGLRVIRLDIPSPLFSESGYKEGFVPGRSFISYALAVIRSPVVLLRKAISWNADMIHVQELPYSLGALVAARILGIPMFLEFRQPFPLAVSYNLRHLRRGLLGRFLVKSVEKAFTIVEILTCQLTDLVVSISDEEKRRLIRFGVPREKIVVIMHLPEIAEFSGGGERSFTKVRPIIIYAGHIIDWKGIDLLLEAFAQLQEKVPDARLVLLGDGSSRKSLEEQARKLSISSKVSFHGWLRPADAFDLIRASDIAVIPHVVSSMPNKLFTYMHCGKPIVASDYPGIRAILEQNQCGVLFRSGDAKDLSEKLGLLLLDEMLRLRLAANAKIAAMQRYNWENESRKLLDIYSRLQHA
jgi:glycosyltransferase involved in cell wall biosynthesis